MGWCHVFTLLSLQMLFMSALLLSADVITVFQGTRVVLPSCVSDVEFSDVLWRLKQHSETKLLAMLRAESNWTVIAQDSWFEITENGSLVLLAAHLDAAEFICEITLLNGTIQKHMVELHIQHHNISSVTPLGNLTTNLIPENQRGTFLIIVIACPVAAAVLLLGILSFVICRCRKDLTDERIYANVGRREASSGRNLSQANLPGPTLKV
ncbi:hypothetical protein ACEWY4_022903 [Coilia grayii]|uniref:Ig-like domain-containing protein n=1 Tax=Coilia grayii TaxID=363190 RepID=A0ABD1J1H0_9TELE